MLAPPIPPDEELRLEDLRRLEILLLEPEESFDRITGELARIFEVSAVSMSFTDHDTQYNKSIVGVPADMEREERSLSVCSHVIGANDMLVVEDLLADDRFRDNPFVVSSGARFYAGTPLRSDAGRAVGTLCIIDHRPRTISERERGLLRVVAEGVMAQVKVHLASRRLLERSKELDRDLRQAVHVQRSLLPPPVLEGQGWRITHLYRPFEHLGGDFLDVQPTPDGRWAILVADVSGHGTSAALTAAMAKTAFLRAVESGDRPAAYLNAIHTELVDAAHPGQFMTALAAIFEPSRRRIEIASAGHPHPLLIRGDRVKTVEHENELMLLVTREAHYAGRTALELEPGDRLLVFTDGAFEATDAAGRMLEIEGLSRFAGDALRVRPDAFLNEVMTRLDRYTGNRFDDDVALLCIECP